MHKNLKHLSESDIDVLMYRYYDKHEDIKTLLADYEIDVHPSQLVSLFPPIVYEDRYCDYCAGVNLIAKRLGRSGVCSPSPFCSKCGHKEGVFCNCENCRQERGVEQEQLEKRKRQVIVAAYERDAEVPAVEELTLWDSLLLMSFVRHSLSEDLSLVFPFDKAPELAPTYDLKNDIVKHLYAKGLITISADSPIDSFAFNEEETCTTGYYPAEVHWEFLPSMEIDETRAYLDEVSQRVNGEWPESWEEDQISIWQTIAKSECIEYFLYLLAERGFDIKNVGEKTHSVFEELLTKLPVSQIFYLSYLSVRDTTDYIVKKGLSRGHGKNVFIGNLQRRAERAQVEGWTLRHSHRDRNCPQSVVSSTFFNVFLELGDKAIEMSIPHSETE